MRCLDGLVCREGGLRKHVIQKNSVQEDIPTLPAVSPVLQGGMGMKLEDSSLFRSE